MPRTGILIAIHSLFAPNGTPVSGTGSALFELFTTRRVPFTCYHFPIYGGRRALIRTTAATGRTDTRDGFNSPRSFVLRMLAEGAVTLTRLARSRVDLYIGIDPLNALWGIIGRRLFRTVSAVVYYTADYATDRFANAYMNTLYHTIDRICIRYADQVWNVSTRIMDVRSGQGVDPARSFFVPNSPLYLHSGTRHNRFDLVVVGTSVAALDYDTVLEALPDLIREFPRLTLHIMGELRFPADMLDVLRRFERQGRVVLHGSTPHAAVIRILSGAGIGLALYRDAEPWTKYGDSMKMREYFACGLPVISTDVVSTSDVVNTYRCGKTIRPRPADFRAAVRSIYAKGVYERMHKASIAAARRYRYDAMVKEPLSLVGVTV